MLEIIKIDESFQLDSQIKLCDVNEHKPIFAKLDEKLVGMVIKDDRGWILKTGGTSELTEFHETLKACLGSCLRCNYRFFIEKEE